MKSRMKKAMVPTEPVTIRLPSEQVRSIEDKAFAASMDRSPYIAIRMIGEEPESWPALAALSLVIAIHNTVRASKTISAEQLDELQSLLREIAQAAHVEALR